MGSDLMERAVVANARQKGILLPTELRTKELAMLPVWVRERAFFMAAVSRGEILQEFSDRTGRIARGEQTVQEARQEMREALRGLGYRPEPGQEGTIKDLRTVRRMNVALKTNVEQVRGYGRWARQQRVLEAYPAQQFVRLRNAKVPRENWPERFARAVAATTPEGANVPAMAALVNHPCWTELSVFGTPYAPFDFGSGMGIEPLDREEAEGLGLVPGPDAPPEHAGMMAAQTRGLNESLEATPAVEEERFRKTISDALQGLCKWEGKRLIFTDPNGTRPYTAEALAELWRAPMPTKFADLPGGGQMQREAFMGWARDHERFSTDPEAHKPAGGKDYYEDFTRVLRRLEPSGRESEELFRGLRFTTAKNLGDFLAQVERDGYAPRKKYPAESWAGSYQAARKYASKQPYRVILRMPGGHSAARDVTPLTREFAAEIARGEKPVGKLAITDDEILLPSGARLRVKAIRRAQETSTGKVVEIILEERR